MVKGDRRGRGGKQGGGDRKNGRYVQRAARDTRFMGRRSLEFRARKSVRLPKGEQMDAGGARAVGGEERGKSVGPICMWGGYIRAPKANRRGGGRG